MFKQLYTFFGICAIDYKKPKFLVDNPDLNASVSVDVFGIMLKLLLQEWKKTNC